MIAKTELQQTNLKRKFFGCNKSNYGMVNSRSFDGTKNMYLPNEMIADSFLMYRESLIESGKQDSFKTEIYHEYDREIFSPWESVENWNAKKHKVYLMEYHDFNGIPIIYDNMADTLKMVYCRNSDKDELIARINIDEMIRYYIKGAGISGLHKINNWDEFTQFKGMNVVKYLGKEKPNYSVKKPTTVEKWLKTTTILPIDGNNAIMYLESLYHIEYNGFFLLTRKTN